jgi:RNA polymerase sigma factor (sigma-70 family)
MGQRGTPLRATAQRSPAASIEEQCREALARGEIDCVLTLLMREYGRDLHRYCWGLLRQREPAEDVLQTVFVQAHQGLHAFEARSSFKGWLYGIARHRCLDELRRRQRWARIVEDRPGDAEPTVYPDVVHAAPDGALLAQLQECLGRLTATNRELVLLRFQHDTSYDEIAALVGDNSGALRTRVCRSLSALRRCLERAMGND